jgi:hypothetical protein
MLVSDVVVRTYRLDLVYIYFHLSLPRFLLNLFIYYVINLILTDKREQELRFYLFKHSVSGVASWGCHLDLSKVARGRRRYYGRAKPTASSSCKPPSPSLSLSLSSPGHPCTASVYVNTSLDEAGISRSLR